MPVAPGNQVHPLCIPHRTDDTIPLPLQEAGCHGLDCPPPLVVVVVVLPGTAAGRSSSPSTRRHPVLSPGNPRQDMCQRQDVPCTPARGMRHWQEAGRPVRSTSESSGVRGTGTVFSSLASGNPPEEKVFPFGKRGTYGFPLCSGFCGHEHAGGARRVVLFFRCIVVVVMTILASGISLTPS